MTVPESAARRRATLIGGIAILLWAALALFTALTPSIPALQLNAMSFSVAGLAAIVLWLARGETPLRHLRQPPLAWALGVAGLLGYPALYFLALKLAPPRGASPTNHLWSLPLFVFP